jgi:hypothetical protein
MKQWESNPSQITKVKEKLASCFQRPDRIPRFLQFEIQFEKKLLEAIGGSQPSGKGGTVTEKNVRFGTY